MTALDRLARLTRHLGGGPASWLLLGTAVLLLAAGLTIVTLSGGDDLQPGEARLHADGDVEVSIAGARFVSVTRETALGTGDRVRVQGGSAVLELPGGASAELREGSRVEIGAPEGPALALEGGDLLVQVQRAGLEIDGGSAHVVVGAGAAKLRRSASLVAGSYEGSLLVAGTGQSLSVGRLRQASVAGTGRVPDTVRPLTVDEDDEWDRRFLGPVLELDRRLVAFGRGFEGLLPEAIGASPALYRELLPALTNAPLDPEQLAGRSAGENLIGLTIVSMTDGPFATAYRSVFGLRAQGARWGLVAADQRLAPPQVVDSVEEAIGRAPLPVAAPGPGGDDTAAPEPSPGGPTTSTQPRQPPPPGPGPTSPPPPGPGGTTTTTAALFPVPTTVPSTTTTTAPPDDCGLIGVVLGCD